MDINSELMKLSVNFASVLTRNTAQAIIDKIKTAKTTGDRDQVIRNLEEIINDLISDKNELIQIVQAYEEKLIMQKISNEDIEYITENIIPLLERLLQENPDEEAESARNTLNIIKAILSKETLNILQLLGFNFKQAIGEPLTQLVSAIITSKIPLNFNMEELQALQLKREVEYLNVVQDEEAFRRLIEINSK
ncbi:hypothetical protein [Priestia koreensis]|uniref:hypothetical protein n=1 Tax=Priestia koreensis TaxID=284581 RepID=UPI00345A3832